MGSILLQRVLVYQRYCTHLKGHLYWGQMLSRTIHDKALVNGQWVSAKSGKTFPVKNPLNGEVLANVPDMDESDTELSIQAAKTAFDSWRQTTGKERSKLLRKWYDIMISKKEEMAKLITLENGKPVTEALGEIIYSSDYVEFFSEEARRIHGEILSSPAKNKEMMYIRQPIGVCAMIVPWNFPTAMIARKVSAALAAGCTCTIKPSEDTPLSTLLLAATAQEAGIPNGVINVVTSSRNNAPAVGKKFCTSPDIKAISFTGSTAVGSILYQQCAPTTKRMALELGGNAPFIVFETADIDAAVTGCMVSKFRNSGQTCVATNRILVQEPVYEEFVGKLKDAISKLVVGNGLEPTTTVGPLINQEQFKKVSAMVEDATQKGAKVLLGGKPHSLGGTFYEPTLLVDVNNTMKCIQQEIFGPVAMVAKFKTEEEALRTANDTRSGLAAYFYSNDFSQIRRVGQLLEYGMVGINEGLISAAEAPFGGVKESGIGREGSKHGLDEYTEIKYLCIGNLK